MIRGRHFRHYPLEFSGNYTVPPGLPYNIRILPTQGTSSARYDSYKKRPSLL